MRYLCSQCEYSATDASTLKRHVENKHEGVRYPCPECKYAATQKGYLKKHLKNKHKWVNISLFSLLSCCKRITHKFTMTGGYQTFIFLLLQSKKFYQCKLENELIK